MVPQAVVVVTCFVRTQTVWPLSDMRLRSVHVLKNSVKPSAHDAYKYILLFKASYIPYNLDHLQKDYVIVHYVSERWLHKKFKLWQELSYFSILAKAAKSCFMKRLLSFAHVQVLPSPRSMTSDILGTKAPLSILSSTPGTRRIIISFLPALVLRP